MAEHVVLIGHRRDVYPDLATARAHAKADVKYYEKAAGIYNLETGNRVAWVKVPKKRRGNMASKRSVRRRVAKALRKFVRGNPEGGRMTPYYRLQSGMGGYVGTAATAAEARRLAHKIADQYNYPVDIFRAYRNALKETSGKKVARVSPKHSNPARVKGRKVKGGRAVTLRNFTGTIVKKSDGTVQIVGKGKRK